MAFQPDLTGNLVVALSIVGWRCYYTIDRIIRKEINYFAGVSLIECKKIISKHRKAASV